MPSLLLAARDIAEEPVLEAGQARGFDDLSNGQRLRIITREEGDVSPHLQQIGDFGHLKYGPRSRSGGALARVVAEYASGAGSRFRKSGQETDRSRLPCSVWAEERHEFTAFNGETGSIQRCDVGESFGDIL